MYRSSEAVQNGQYLSDDLKASGSCKVAEILVHEPRKIRTRVCLAASHGQRIACEMVCI